MRRAGGRSKGVKRRLGAFLGSIVAASLLSAETIAERTARYASPKLGDAVSVTGVEREAGRFHFTLKKGALAPIVAGSEEIGFYFRGEGSWSYSSDAPEEFAVLRHNAGEVARWKPEESPGRLTVHDTFRELFWVEPGKTAPPGTKGAGNRELDDAFDRHVKSYTARRKGDSLAQRLAYRSVQKPGAPLAWGEFTGGKTDGLYVLDGADNLSEELRTYEKLEFDSANAPWEWTTDSISARPLGVPFRQSTPNPVFLTQVEPEIEADGKHAKISVAETYEAGPEEVRAVHLDLRNRVFAESALDVRRQQLVSVTDAEGRELSFDHRCGHVLVELARPVESGHAFTLTFRMEGDVLFGTSGDNSWILGFDAWYPRPGLGGAAFNWKCTLKVRKPYIPIVSGDTISRREEGDWNVLTAQLDHPVTYPVVIAGKYNIEEEEVDGRKVRIASYAFANHRATEKLLKLTSEIIRFYEPFLGPFPWKEFTIVELNSYGFGIAPPATMFITQEAFSPLRDDVTKYFAKSLDARFAHEIAHQYWGHQVKWESDTDEWLSESFAEYCSALLIRKEKGNSFYRSMTGSWLGALKEAGDHASLATANRLEGERAGRDRAGLLYGRGPYLLFLLHRELGDETFQTFLKTFQSNRRWKFGTTAQVEELLEVMTRKSYRDFFERYYWGTEIPPKPD